MKNLVYLINGGDNTYKIGISSEKGLKTRIKNLQTGSSSELKLINTYKTNYASLIEKTLHRELLGKKIIGEWFELTDNDVFTFIERCTIIDNNIKYLKNQNNNYILKIIK